MVEAINGPLTKLIDSILDPTVDRSLDEVTLEFLTNLGEIKRIGCSSIEEAARVLDRFDFNLIFNDEGGVSITDPPPDITNGE